VTATVLGTRKEIELEHALAREADDGDNRFYVLFAGTPQEQRFRSVTGATSRWDKDGLQVWAALLAAQEAFEIMTLMAASIFIQECGRSWHTRCGIPHDWDVRCPDCRCRECSPCLTRHLRDRSRAESARRMDEGSRIHAIADHWSKVGLWLEPEDDIVAYIESFKRFVADYGLRPEDWEMAEARVINRTHGYAGTLDALVWIRRGRAKLADDFLDRLTKDGEPRVQQALVLIDYKSREKEDRAVFMDMPLQLAGYRFAETIVLADGTELPMMQVDAAAVIQIRPDQAQLIPMLVEEPEFKSFLALLEADGWALERGKAAIEKNTFKYAPSVTKLRQADQRKAAKERKQLEQAAAAAAGPVVASPVATEPLERPAAAPTPQERGAKAAAAARRGPAPALQDLQAHGKRVGSHPRGGRQVNTLEASVLGVGGREDPSDEIPF
jgi:hypothetical protein